MLRNLNKTGDNSGFASMSSAVEFADNYHRWIISKFRKYIKGNILEVGTGKSYYNNIIRPTGTFVSIDNDDAIIRFAKEINPAGIYYHADIADKATLKDIEKYVFQTIICFNVLEHIKEHEAGLNNMIDLVENEGHLLLFVPAFLSLYNSKDRLAGHLRRYTKKTFLQLLSNKQNIYIEKFEYFNPVGAIGQWVNRSVTHKSLNNKSIARQTRIFDKYLIHLSIIMNVFTKKYFGQSLICVIKKKK